MTVYHDAEVRFARAPTEIRIQSDAEIRAQERQNEVAVNQQEFIRLQSAIAQVNESLIEYEQRRQAMLTEMQAVAVELATAVAAKLVFHEIENGEEFVRPLIENELQSIDRPLDALVRLHPDDFDAFQRIQSGNQPLDTGQLTFRADPGLAKGDCLVETGSNTFVSSVQTKLSEIRQNLMESLHDAEIERRKNENQHRGIRRFPDRRATG